MKFWAQILSPLLMAALLPTVPAVKADSFLSSLPGNGGSMPVGTELGNVEWAAVGFTPSENCTVSSVTLWLTGYNGLSYGPGPMVNYAPVVGIYTDDNLSEFGGPAHGPGDAISFLTTPAANDGSAASFTFDSSAGITLQANVDYWLVVQGTDEYTQAGFTWDGGSTPTGPMAYNGSEEYQTGEFYQPSTATPAFSINDGVAAVPEPSTFALMMIPLGLQGARWLRKRAAGPAA